MPTIGSISNSEFTHREDTAAVSGDVGAAVLGVRNDTAAVTTTTDGDYSQISTDSAGRVGITDLGGSITVDAVDLDIRNLVFATDKVDVTGSTVTLDAGTLAALETITVLQGTSPWVIGDGGGSITVDGTITADTNFDYVEDSPHTTGEIGAFVLAVRNDANAAMTTTNGDYSPIAVNANGAVAINDGGNSITVDGTVAVTQSTSPWVTSLDAGTLAALESITVQNGAGAAAVNIQDGGNSITVDGAVTVSGTITTNYERAEDSPHTSTNIGAFVLAVRNDAGTPLAADQDYIPFTTDATGALRVNAGTAAATGRDDTDNQAPVATGLNTNVVRNYIFDGANWDRWTGAVTGTVTVNQGTSPWVTSLDAATLTALESITVQNGAGAAAVNIQDGGNSITVDGSVSITGAVTTASERAEDSVHNSGDVGSFALAVRNNAGTPLAADQDYIPFTTDTNGDLYVTTGRNGSIANGAETAITNTAAQILAANTARKKYIVQNVGAANIRVGITGVTATTGFRLIPSGSMVIEMPNCPTNAIFAIREGATNSIAFAQEIT